MSKILCADGGMNWDWFMLAEVNDDGTATILGEDRFHRHDYSQGADINDKLSKLSKHRYRMIENHSHCFYGPTEPRRILAISIDDVRYDLAKPIERWNRPGLTMDMIATL